MPMPRVQNNVVIALTNLPMVVSIKDTWPTEVNICARTDE